MNAGDILERLEAVAPQQGQRKRRQQPAEVHPGKVRHVEPFRFPSHRPQSDVEECGDHQHNAGEQRDERMDGALPGKLVQVVCDITP